MTCPYADVAAGESVCGDPAPEQVRVGSVTGGFCEPHAAALAAALEGASRE